MFNLFKIGSLDRARTDTLIIIEVDFLTTMIFITNIDILFVVWTFP